MPNPVFLLIVVMSAVGHFLPGVTRPDIFFGVTVDLAFRSTSEARRIVRNYRVAIWGAAIVACAIDLVMHRISVGMIVYVVGFGSALVVSHRSALPHAASRATTIEVDLAAPRERIPGGLMTALLPLIVLLGVRLWVATSSRAIIVLLAEQAFVIVVLIALALGVLHWSRRICASGPAAASERQFRRRTVLLIVAVEYFMVMPPIFGLLQAPALAMQMWSVALSITIASVVTRWHRKSLRP